VVTMTPKPAAPLTGSVRRASDGALVQDAEVTVEGTPLAAFSAPNGVYTINGVPVGTHEVRCYRPGYAPGSRWTPVETGVARSVDWKLLRAAWYDSCDTDRGWSLEDLDDNSVGGRWVRAIPNGTTGQNARALPRLAPQHDEPAEGFLPIGPVAPSTDATPGADAGYCFVTGNGPPGSDPAAYDVDLGKTTLTTPLLDLSGMTEPTLSWKRWFHMNTPGEPDSFVIQITRDGVNWVTVRSLIESHAEWHEDVIRVKDFIVPSASVRVRFIAQDQPPVEGVVEAGVDDFEAYDASLVPADVASTPTAAPPVLLEAPRPNPSSRATTVSLHLKKPGHATVAVYDVAGRRVAILFDGAAPAGPLTLEWNGRDSRGREAGSGVYWIRAEAAGENRSRALVRLK